MKKLALAAFAAAMLAIPASAADLSGSWTLSGDVVGNPIDMKCAFTQEGAKFSGTCTGDRGSASTSGSVAGNQVTFEHSIQADQVYDLTYTGTLDAAGTSIKGDIAVEGITGTFSATKDAAAASANTVAASADKDAAPKASAAPGISGAWTITGDVAGNAINMKCALTADGAKVSGNCTYEGLGDSQTAGTVTGDKVTLQNSAQNYDLTYTGTLDAAGASISGDIDVAGVTGSFTGAKDK